jgi:hypothetical protein
MKTSTAMNVILKESLFTGMSIVDVMKDVLKHGRMIYSDRVVQAVQIVANI